VSTADVDESRLGAEEDGAELDVGGGERRERRGVRVEQGECQSERLGPGEGVGSGAITALSDDDMEPHQVHFSQVRSANNKKWYNK
jgi:hypothetical protein